MATVEGADAHGEHEVVRVFLSLERELFDPGSPDAQAPRLDQLGTTGSRLCDRGSGPIDRENVTGGQPRRDRACGRARSALTARGPVGRSANS